MPRISNAYTVVLILGLVIGCHAGAPAMAFGQAQAQASVETASRPAGKITLRKTGPQESTLTLVEIRAELKKNPSNVALYYRAGFLEEQRGELVQALRDYQDAINGKNRVADAYYRSGVVWEKTGEFYDLKNLDSKGRVINEEQRQRAIDSYRAAVRVRPDFADAYYRLSLVYLFGDAMREANESYQKLHQLEPDTDRTRQLLLMIYKRHQQQSRSKK